MSDSRSLLIRFWQRLTQAARLSVGVPDFHVYCEHMRRAHPEQAPFVTPNSFASAKLRAMEARTESVVVS